MVAVDAEWLRINLLATPQRFGLISQLETSPQNEEN
jgi:hypothetical protein